MSKYLDRATALALRTFRNLKEAHKNIDAYDKQRVRAVFGDNYEQSFSVLKRERDNIPSCVPVFTLLFLLSGDYDRWKLRQPETFANPKLATFKILDALFLARWAECGLPVFSLTHSLLASLLLTDPPKFSGQLPFPAFFISIPPGFISAFCKQSGRRENLQRITIQKFVSVGGVPHLYMELQTQAGGPILACPIDQVDRLSAETEEGLADARSVALCWRLVLNLVAWIEAHGNGISNKQKRSTFKTEGNQDFPETWILGQEIKLSPELRRLAVEYAAGNEKATPGWKLRMRFCVRGHWKMQPCGPGGTERKRIFVEPYWKGPEGAAAWQHVYKAGEENH